MKGRLKNIRTLFLPLLAIAAVNLFSYFFHAGVDLTAEKRFTLASSTKAMVRGLKEPLTLTVYLEGDIPAGFKRLASAAEEMGSSFRSISNGKFQVVFEKPGEGLGDTAKAILFDSLQRLGINPTNVKAQEKKGEQREETLVFPGAVLTGSNGAIGIDFLEGQSNLNGLESLNNAEALMEYKLAKAVMLLTRDTIPLVGYLTGNGQPLDLSVYDLVEKVLRKDHRFRILPIDSVAYIPDEFAALVIAKPTKPFNAAQKLKIDQYIMHGGKLLWAVDNLYASMDSLQKSSGSFVAFDMGLDLDEQLFKYGLRINRDLLQDLECDKVPSVIGSIGDKPQIELLPWPYAPFLRNTGDHPISKNLDFVLSSFPQTIDTIAAPGIRKQVILGSSSYSRTLQTPALVEWRSIKTEEDLTQFNKKNKAVAVLLEGKFRSALANRISSADLQQLAVQYKRPFLSAATSDNSMIVISDGDILTNAVSQQDGPMAMGMNSYTRQQYANRDFISNCLFYLTGGASIMEARSKTFRLRLLDKEQLENNKLFWQMLNILFPLAFPLGLYFLYRFLRKRKYARKG